MKHITFSIVIMFVFMMCFSFILVEVSGDINEGENTYTGLENAANRTGITGAVTNMTEAIIENIALILPAIILISLVVMLIHKVMTLTKD